MSKKIIAGALSVAVAVSAFAVLAMPAFAATTGWHQVTVTPGQELILGGSVSSNTVLTPTITTNDSGAAGALTVQSTHPWQIQWQAVQGSYTPTPSATAATGTNLGVAGFTNAGGYAYAGATATTGTDSWGASIAATGGTVAGTYGLTTSLTTIVTGTATSNATVTPTYSAGTSGSLGTATYYGTIYYSLVTNP